MGFPGGLVFSLLAAAVHVGRTKSREVLPEQRKHLGRFACDRSSCIDIPQPIALGE